MNAPQRHGRPWTPEEDQALGEAFNDGKQLHELALLHQRKRTGIQSRLVHLGLIVHCPALRCYHATKAVQVWATYKDVKE
jgi:hypothetical protein